MSSLGMTHADLCAAQAAVSDRLVGAHLWSYNDAEYRFHTGRLSEDEWWAWQHVWVVSAPRISSLAENAVAHPDLEPAASIATALGCGCEG